MQKILWLLWLMQAGLGHAATFRLGIEPFLSPRMLVQSYAPMARGLEPVLGRVVEVGTGTQPVHFMKRAVQGDFDLVVVPPPMAAYLEQRQHFTPVAYLRNDFFALVLVHRSSAARSLSDLRGRQIHLANVDAYITSVGRDFLAAASVSLDRDLRLITHPSENSAILAGQSSRQDAVLVSRAVFERMPEAIKDDMKVLGSTRSAVSQVVMIHPRLPAAQTEPVRQALIGFMYTAEGNRWFLKQGVTLSSRKESMPFNPGQAVTLWHDTLLKAGVQP